MTRNNGGGSSGARGSARASSLAIRVRMSLNDLPRLQREPVDPFHQLDRQLTLQHDVSDRLPLSRRAVLQVAPDLLNGRDYSTSAKPRSGLCLVLVPVRSRWFPEPCRRRSQTGCRRRPSPAAHAVDQGRRRCPGCGNREGSCSGKASGRRARLPSHQQNTSAASQGREAVGQHSR